jgi:hypothetical protein
MQLISWSTLSQGCLVFTSDLFYTFCTLSHPTYGNQTGPKCEGNSIVHTTNQTYTEWTSVMASLILRLLNYLQWGWDSLPLSLSWRTFK